VDGAGAQFSRFATFRFASGIRFAHEYPQVPMDDAGYFVVSPQPYRVVLDPGDYEVALEDGLFSVTIEDTGMRPEVHRPPLGGRSRERW
jgi:hypothetical protein